MFWSLKKKKDEYTKENENLDIENLSQILESKVSGLLVYGHSEANILETINIGLELYDKMKNLKIEEIKISCNKTLTIKNKRLELNQH